MTIKFFLLIKLWSSDSKKYSIASYTRLRKESYEKVSKSQLSFIVSIPNQLSLFLAWLDSIPNECDDEVSPR
ncbi:hypothetical protein J1N35_016995 [Gossypium stocksii]|uniref:Uncharacterized protein n=1 Tax=Gossypium stocksii TaxID=47602 RepID=A0A9D4A5B8_9ROSI|nr:hypothetical protein J1N35_016995 [Gossypium stocksii]